eukprot:704162-Prorocentrum_minimum.AAC.1
MAVSAQRSTAKHIAAQYNTLRVTALKGRGCTIPRVTQFCKIPSRPSPPASNTATPKVRYSAVQSLQYSTVPTVQYSSYRTVQFLQYSTVHPSHGPRASLAASPARPLAADEAERFARGRENITRVLLEFGADASKTSAGRSAMYYAVFSDRIGIIRLLIERGAPPPPPPPAPPCPPLPPTPARTRSLAQLNERAVPLHPLPPRGLIGAASGRRNKAGKRASG